MTQVKLSTQLIDVNWDRAILQSCMNASTTANSFSTSNYAGEIPIELEREKQIINTVYERMYDGFLKELF